MVLSAYDLTNGCHVSSTYNFALSRSLFTDYGQPRL